MPLIVPFDGSELAEAALVRATQFNTVLNEEIAVVTVIPTDNTQYARKRGWIDEHESFDGETIVTRLQHRVEKISPDAHFEYDTVGRYAQAGAISSKIRRFAREHDASIVFIGSENAGRVVQNVSSVGGAIAADRGYETMIIPYPQPAKIEELEQTLPTEEILDRSSAK